jgi:tetratricopeptide (TPR) repeat protein
MSSHATPTKHEPSSSQTEYAQPKPALEQDRLQTLVGEWETEIECHIEQRKPPLKSKGTESVRSIGGFATEDADQRSHALKEMARCARHAREFNAGRLAWEEILATCRVTGSAEGEVEAHNQLAEFSQLLGDHAAAISSLRKAAELRQRTGSALQSARQWLSLASYLTSRIRVRDAFAALALAREAAEKAENVGLLSQILALEGFVLAKAEHTGGPHVQLHSLN